MNRLTPLVRRQRTFGTAVRYAEVVRAPLPAEQAARWVDDARQFALGWVGGLVFFGTFIA